MKKIIVIIGVIVVMVGAGIAVAALGNEGQMKSPGPAPNSHDGIPDGPGW